MSAYFEAPDGEGEPCIWAKGERFDMPLIRQRETGPAYWPDVVARMTGTTITNAPDDVAVDRAVDAWFASAGASDELDSDWRQRMRAALAALTGVPHD